MLSGVGSITMPERGFPTERQLERSLFHHRRPPGSDGPHLRPRREEPERLTDVGRREQTRQPAVGLHDR
jgi:hypothetical protein